MKNILFVVTHRPDRSPGQRFRIEQYLPSLERNGFHCESSYYITERGDRVLYATGKYLQKFFLFLHAINVRMKDVWRAKRYDIIFIQRETFMTGSAFFERQLAKSKAKIVFDFDDTIWIPNVSEANRRLSWLKNPDKTSALIALADVVFAGNRYLANYASQFNSNVVIIPTTVDTDEYAFPERIYQNDQAVCIGWTGSLTTISHFKLVVSALKKIKERFTDKVRFVVSGDANYLNEELEIEGINWSKETEKEQLRKFDIGLMPLPDDEWSRGKCGLKGLLYMAMSIPAVMSPVGVNNEIIQDGANGFLCANEDEWVEKLTRLIESPALRKQLGYAARKTVEEKYSVHSQVPTILNIFQSLSEK